MDSEAFKADGWRTGVRHGRAIRQHNIIEPTRSIWPIAGWAIVAWFAVILIVSAAREARYGLEHSRSTITPTPTGAVLTVRAKEDSRG